MRRHFLDFLLLYQARTRYSNYVYIVAIVHFIIRQLAQQQLSWFKKELSFHWLNMAPNDIELPVDLVAKGVAEWFVSGKPLCPEWSGQPLQSLVNKDRCCYDNHTFNIADSIREGTIENIFFRRITKTYHIW